MEGKQRSTSVLVKSNTGTITASSSGTITFTLPDWASHCERIELEVTSLAMSAKVDRTGNGGRPIVQDSTKVALLGATTIGTMMDKNRVLRDIDFEKSETVTFTFTDSSGSNNVANVTIFLRPLVKKAV